MVWLLIVKLGAVQSTYMAKFAMTSWKLKTVRSISCAFPATYRVGCMTTLHSPKSKQMLGAILREIWSKHNHAQCCAQSHNWLTT